MSNEKEELIRDVVLNILLMNEAMKELIEQLEWHLEEEKKSKF